MKIDYWYLQAIWAAKSILRRVNESSPLLENERFVSYLPLSHVAAQLLDVYMAITHDITVFFAQPDALKVGIISF